MKFIMIGPVYPYRGGIAHYTASIVRELSRLHELRVLSFQQQYPTWLYPGSTDQDPSEEFIETEADFIISALNPISWIHTIRVIRRWKPDAVVINWWVTYWSFALGVIALGAKRIGIPVIFLDHNVLPHEPKLWDSILVKFALGKGDGHIVHSILEKEKLDFLLPDSHSIFCPLPLYDFVSADQVAASESRGALQLPDEGPIVLFFGIVRPYKGLDILLDAIALLKKREKYPLLVVAGEIWGKKEKYFNLVEELGITSQVLFINKYIPNEDVKLFFSAADLFVAPYKRGTQSGPLTLAIRFGVPAIATKHIAAALELINSSQLHIINNADPNELAAKIQDVLEHHIDVPRKHNSNPENWDLLVESIIRLTKGSAAHRSG